MKKFFLLVVTALLAVNFSYGSFQIIVNTSNKIVKGNGIVKSENRLLEKFTDINSSGAFEIKITAQKEQSFKIEAEENILPLIITEVKNNTLFVKLKKSVEINKPIKIVINLRSLNGITHFGSSNYNVKNLNNNNFELNAHGSGLVTAQGTGEKANYNIYGAGNINMEKFKIIDVQLTVQGSATAEIYAEKSLNIEVSGMATVLYSGNPKVKKNINGLADIRKVE